MAIEIQPEDLLEFSPDLSPNQAEIMIKNAIAIATFHAPCLASEDLEENQESVAYAVILDALRRWSESGAGALSSETHTAGPFGQTLSYDNRTGIRTGYYPSEISLLKQICGSSRKKRSRPFMTSTITDRKNCPVSGCAYLLGSSTSPCTDCGETINPNYRL